MHLFGHCESPIHAYTGPHVIIYVLSNGGHRRCVHSSLVHGRLKGVTHARTCVRETARRLIKSRRVFHFSPGGGPKRRRTDPCTCTERACCNVPRTMGTVLRHCESIVRDAPKRGPNGVRRGGGRKRGFVNGHRCPECRRRLINDDSRALHNAISRATKLFCDKTRTQTGTIRLGRNASRTRAVCRPGGTERKKQ